MMNSLSSCLRSFKERHRQASRRFSTTARRARRSAFRPDMMFLEERLTLTTAIAVTNAFLVNASDQRLTTVSVGEQVYVQVDFTTQRLLRSASYRAARAVCRLRMATVTRRKRWTLNGPMPLLPGPGLTLWKSMLRPANKTSWQAPKWPPACPAYRSSP